MSPQEAITHILEPRAREFGHGQKRRRYRTTLQDWCRWRPAGGFQVVLCCRTRWIFPDLKCTLRCGNGSCSSKSRLHANKARLFIDGLAHFIYFVCRRIVPPANVRINLTPTSQHNVGLLSTVPTYTTPRRCCMRVIKTRPEFERSSCWVLEILLAC